MSSIVGTSYSPPITELGFIRILSQVSRFGLTVADARILLAAMKHNKQVRFRFLKDGNDMSQLPSWVMTHKQTTDGHLAQLARDNEAIFATCDENIPDSFLIPWTDTPVPDFPKLTPPVRIRSKGRTLRR
jgi:hypothetical protein